MKIRRTYIITIVFILMTIIIWNFTNDLAINYCLNKLNTIHYHFCIENKQEMYGEIYFFSYFLLLSVIFTILSIAKVSSDGFDSLVLKYKNSKK